MSANQPWRKSVQAYIRFEARPVDKYGHQPRLYALACQVGEGEVYDDDVVFAAAWMHDLGVFLGHRPESSEELAAWDHVPYTIRKSRELLESWGFPREKLELVAEVIRTHQPKDHPTTMEAIVVRDADILEQLGATGALRALVKIGKDTRFRTYSDVLPVLEQAAANLPARLILEKSKILGQKRVELLRQLLAGIESEAGPLLF